MENNTIPVTKQNIQTQPAATQQVAQPVQPEQKFDFPVEYIDLPSEGHFYPASSPLSSGRIQLKCMTAREEDILTNQNLIKKGVVLDELLKALIVTPNVKLDDILVGDKNAIFVAARRLAYGDEYPAKITCPKCGEENDVKVNLSELKAKAFDFNKYAKGENAFSFELPVSKKTVVYRLLTHKDEGDIDAELKGLAKISKANAPEMTTRLKYSIVSIDGSNDRGVVKKFVDNMLAKDSIALRKHIRENTPDLDMTFDFTCSACGHNERMAMPLGVDFFWPST
jgi:transcription elongation factor Elf1